MQVSKFNRKWLNNKLPKSSINSILKEKVNNVRARKFEIYRTLKINCIKSHISTTNSSAALEIATYANKFICGTGNRYMPIVV
jgi:hypothetical protein